MPRFFCLAITHVASGSIILCNVLFKKLFNTIFNWQQFEADAQICRRSDLQTLKLAHAVKLK